MYKYKFRILVYNINLEFLFIIKFRILVFNVNLEYKI